MENTVEGWNAMEKFHRLLTIGYRISSSSANGKTGFKHSCVRNKFNMNFPVMLLALVFIFYDCVCLPKYVYIQFELEKPEKMK